MCTIEMYRVDSLKNLVKNFIESDKQSKVDSGNDLVEVTVNDSNLETQETILTIKEDTANDSNKENLNQEKNEVFGYFGDDRNKKLPQYWVQYGGYPGGGGGYPGGGGGYPGGGGGYDGGYGQQPLDYTPDRNAFVRLVLGIVLVMLLVTACAVGAVYFTSLRSIFLEFSMWLFLSSLICMMCLSCYMGCIDAFRRPPCNIICLVLAVIFMSIATSAITARYKTEIIFYTLLVTVVVVLVCVLLACSSFDFTKFMIYFIVIATVFSVIVSIYFITTLLMGVTMKLVTIIIIAIASLINCIFLIMELQMVLGGRTFEFSEDDYAYAAFSIYYSIVNLFIQLLQLFGLLSGEN